MINQFPGYFSLSILAPAPVMATYPLLQVIRMPDVVAAVPLALKNVDEVIHLTKQGSLPKMSRLPKFWRERRGLNPQPSA